MYKFFILVIPSIMLNILVVLISLVLIFKTQLTNLVKSIFSKIVSQSNSV